MPETYLVRGRWEAPELHPWRMRSSKIRSRLAGIA